MISKIKTWSRLKFQKIQIIQFAISILWFMIEQILSSLA